MQITYFHPAFKELVGAIPTFLLKSDPCPAAEQFNEAYAHGGGWRPMDGWVSAHIPYEPFGKILTIKYPGDPAYWPVAHIAFRDEAIWFYPHAWVAIEQADGSVQIARMD